MLINHAWSITNSNAHFLKMPSPSLKNQFHWWLFLAINNDKSGHYHLSGTGGTGNVLFGISDGLFGTYDNTFQLAKNAPSSFNHARQAGEERSDQNQTMVLQKCDLSSVPGRLRGEVIPRYYLPWDPSSQLERRSTTNFFKTASCVGYDCVV
jgi:hypothetical protein